MQIQKQPFVHLIYTHISLFRPSLLWICKVFQGKKSFLQYQMEDFFIYAFVQSKS